MTDLDAMLDAHVRFELARWQGEAFVSSLREEAAALFAWLESAPLRALTPDPDVLARSVARLPLTDEAVALLAEVVMAMREHLASEELTLTELLEPEHVDALLAVLVGMEDVRREALALATQSEAYTKLVSHVLYQGLKGFVLTDNLLARKIPGASTLMKAGQRRLTSAAPGLEANLDRQLTGFVKANIGETLRESRRYLETTLDEEMLGSMASESWESLSGRTLASLAALVDGQDLAALVAALAPVVRRAQQTGLLAAGVSVVLADLLERHGDRPVADVLADLGLSPDLLVDTAVAAAGRLVEQAVADGQLESRIRARLEPFYRSYPSAP